jgi:hypothetical protein
VQSVAKLSGSNDHFGTLGDPEIRWRYRGVTMIGERYAGVVDRLISTPGLTPSL